MKRALKIFGVLGGVVLALAAIFLVYAIGVTAGVKLAPEKLTLETSCLHFYDVNGDRIAPPARADVPFSELPPHLPQAFVAVEDKRFYQHGGVDVLRMGKAALKNLASFSFREGASTISQQLIKNTHLSGEKTLKRKLREIKLTRMLEARYSKEEILGLYLNSIYFGHSAFGIGEAARFYFGKLPKELTPAESALLAALVKSPNRYSPFKNAEKCLARRNFVLSLMERQGYLTPEECAAASEEPLPASPHEGTGTDAYFALAAEEFSARFPDLGTGGSVAIEVYTAFDPALQRRLEACAAESDLSIVAMKKDGTVRALTASAGCLKRQPASTIKPLLVYAPAIEENLVSPATPIADTRVDFGGYMPDDAGGASGGYMSVRRALAGSVNIPAVRILNSLGVEKGAAYLGRMGLPVETGDRTLALALGGMREGFDLVSLTNGYTTLANGGMYTPASAILRVETAGRTLYARENAARRVFSEETAFLVSDMLRTAATEGTARKLKSLPFWVAAKTGTNEGKTGNLDAYTIAYTTEDAVGVWLGNADHSPVAATGGGLPANIAKSVLEALYEQGAPAAPVAPKGVVRAAYDGEEYAKNHRLLRADPAAPRLLEPEEYFKADALPQEISTRFSRPTIQKPQISVKNGTVSIVLCQTEYYDYIIKRENRGEIATIYQGAFRPCICDNSVRAGESYKYFVIPVYAGHEGAPVELERVSLPQAAPPDDWWDQNVMRSAVVSASSMSASISSFPSSRSTSQSLGRVTGCSGKKTVQQSS